jgi:hypothetical protein
MDLLTKMIPTQLTLKIFYPNLISSYHNNPRFANEYPAHINE